MNRGATYLFDPNSGSFVFPECSKHCTGRVGVIVVQELTSKNDHVSVLFYLKKNFGSIIQGKTILATEIVMFIIRRCR